MANRFYISNNDVRWSYAAAILGSGVGFLLLPILTYFLSRDLLALWYIFLTLGAIVTLLDFGLTPSLSRNMTNAWSGASELLKFGTSKTTTDEPNYELMSLVMGSSRLLYFGIAVIAAALLSSAGTAYLLYISSDVPVDMVLPAWLVFCAAVFLNVFYEYYATYLRGIGCIGIYSKISIASKAIQLMLTVVLLLLGLGLLAPAIAYMVSGFSLRLLSRRAFLDAVDASGHSVLLRRPSFSELKNMIAILWPNSWRDGLVSLADYLTTQGTTIVCSLFLTLADAGMYAIGVQLITVVNTVSAVYCNAKRPMIQNAYIANDRNLLKKEVARSMGSYACLFLMGTLAVAFVVAPLITFINAEYQFSIVFLFFLAAYFYLIGRYKLYAGFIAMTNDLSYYVAFIVSGALGLCLSYAMLLLFGSNLYVLVGSMLLVQLAYNVWHWPRYFLEKVGFKELDIVKAVFSFDC